MGKLDMRKACGQESIDRSSRSHGIRSEALECVQLAAAFAPASLLAGTFARDKEIEGRIGVVLLIAIPASELAGRESGSKLHALQSFAP